nr:STAS domain-containing protein [Chitinivorax tropicus]
MHGALTDRHAGQLRELADFAHAHSQVLVDATDLSRVDFISAGNLLNTLIPMVSAGKPVVFDHVNALVFALFRIMGINDLVMVRRRK